MVLASPVLFSGGVSGMLGGGQSEGRREDLRTSSFHSRVRSLSWRTRLSRSAASFLRASFWVAMASLRAVRSARSFSVVAGSAGVMDLSRALASARAAAVSCWRAVRREISDSKAVSRASDFVAADWRSAIWRAASEDWVRAAERMADSRSHCVMQRAERAREQPMRSGFTAWEGLGRPGLGGR